MQGHERARIELDTDIHGKKTSFDVEMNHRKGPAFGLTIVQDDKEYKNNEAVEFLKSLDLDYYSDIVLSMQGDQDVTQLSPTARSNYLQRLLNFDFTAQIDRVKSDLQKNTVRRVEIDKVLGIKDSLLKRNVKDDLVSSEKISSLQKSVETIDEVRAELDVKGNEIEALEKRISSLGNSSSELTELNERKIKLLSKKGEIEREVKDQDSIRSSLSDKESFLKEKRDCLDREESILDSKESDFMSLQAEIDRHRMMCEVSQVYFDKLNRLDELLSEGKCPHCGQDTYKTSTSSIDTLCKEVIEDTNVNKYRIDGKNETMRDYVQDLLETGIKTSRRKFEEKTSEFGTVNKERESAVVQVSVMRRDVESLETEIEDLKRRRDDSIELDALELKVIDDEVTGIENEVESLKRDGVLVSKLRTDRDEVSRRFNELQRKLDELQRFERDLDDERTTLRKLSEERASLENEIEEFKKENSLLLKDTEMYEEAIKILDKDLPNYMIVKTCASLQYEMNEFIHQIFPEYDVKLIQKKSGTEFYYTQDRTLGDDVPNAWINSKMSSGFERAMLTIAFKQSLCKMYGLSFIVLDEADGSADDDSSSKLFEQVLGDETFDQLFVISHKKKTCQEILDIEPDSKLYVVESGKVSLSENGVYDVD